MSKRPYAGLDPMDDLIESDPLIPRRKLGFMEARRLTWSVLIFGILSVLLATFDVASDIGVAFEYRAEGHNIWFWLCMAILFLSNVVYAAVPAISIHNSGFPCFGRFGERWEEFLKDRVESRALRILITFSILTPLGQIVPQINWVMNTFWPEDEVEEVEPEEIKEGLAALRAGMGRLVEAHSLLLAETAVESIPQVLLQLVAINVVGRSTTLSTISVITSTFSIVSKSYIISLNSYTVSMVIFQSCLLSHDIFSLLFLSCANFGGEHTFPLLPGAKINGPLGLWLWKEAVLLGALFLSFPYIFKVMSELLAQYLHDEGLSNGLGKWTYLSSSILVLLTCSLLLGPFLILLEGMKLSWLLLPLIGLSQGRDTEINLAMYNFVSKGSPEDRIVYLSKEVETVREAHEWPAGKMNQESLWDSVMDFVQRLRRPHKDRTKIRLLTFLSTIYCLGVPISLAYPYAYLGLNMSQMDLVSTTFFFLLLCTLLTILYLSPRAPIYVSTWIFLESRHWWRDGFGWWRRVDTELIRKVAVTYDLKSPYKFLLDTLPNRWPADIIYAISLFVNPADPILTLTLSPQERIERDRRAAAYQRHALGRRLAESGLEVSRPGLHARFFLSRLWILRNWACVQTLAEQDVAPTDVGEPGQMLSLLPEWGSLKTVTQHRLW